MQRRERNWLIGMLVLVLAMQSMGALIAAASAPHASASRFVASVAVAVVLAAITALSAAHRRHAQETAQSWFAAGIAPWIAIAAIAATLLAPGREGVHRWLALGRVSLHISSALAPWVLASAFDRARQRFGWWSFALCVTLQCVHFAQPDLAQSIACSLAALVLVAMMPGALLVRSATAVVVIALSIATAARRDPLGAVAEVEQIARLAFALGPMWGVAALALLVAWVALIAAGPRRWSAISLALAGYAAAVAGVAIATERFPVAWLGAGAGPVIGAFVLLRVLWNRRTLAQRTQSNH